ncbi:hypothetical protein [Streptomyces sp. TRM75561]|uniref:hypothetical protein n=1 Tax=Streptomyces sp. TRM75561 TaxID=2975269 RepID=UPI00244D6483|nr:hypothetical protein [Streptomyces sp. TRM75561]MDH3032745.1 hypothetical protein [Streptomyces sp. TRM75561]
MAQHTPTARICRACDGFAAVAITTGTRLPDGSRATLRVTCPTCKGTGRNVPTALVRAGR